jgi:hypothetical protein
MKEIFGYERQEITEAWRREHNELYNLNSLHR